MKKTTLFFAMTLAMVGAAFSQVAHPSNHGLPYLPIWQNTGPIDWQSFTRNAPCGMTYNEPIVLTGVKVIVKSDASSTCKLESGEVEISVEGVNNTPIPNCTDKNTRNNYTTFCFKGEKKIFLSQSYQNASITITGNAVGGFKISKIEPVNKTKSK